MADYIIAYHGGRKPNSPEEGQAHMQKWKEWVGDLGDAAVNPGTPLNKSYFVSADEVTEGGDKAMSGYSVVKADSIEEAIVMAQSCPFLEMGGTLEVAEMMDMKF